MLESIRRCIGLSCVLVIASCGGGGGGGGGGESASRTGVRVLHAAIDAAPVDVLVTGNTSPVASKAVFALDNSYHALPNGALNLTVTRTANSGAVVGSFTATADSSSKFSILLYGDNSTFGLRTALFADETPADSDGAHLRVVDGVTGAARIALTLSSSAAVEGLQAEFGEAGGYVAVPVGPATIRASRVVDGRVIVSTSATLQAGKAYTYLVAGEVDYFVKGLLLEDN